MVVSMFKVYEIWNFIVCNLILSSDKTITNLLSKCLITIYTLSCSYNLCYYYMSWNFYIHLRKSESSVSSTSWFQICYNKHLLFRMHIKNLQTLKKLPIRRYRKAQTAIFHKLCIWKPPWWNVCKMIIGQIQ